MNIRIGYSPCPNDTFIFDALVNQKIDTGGLRFEPVLEDVETLNAWAQEGKLDITKLSFPAFFSAAAQYQLLPAGSALGKGVGPLLIAREEKEKYDVDNSRIAIPGFKTTANLLLSFAYPQAQHKEAVLFSEIEDAVLSGKSDLGLIIHENRFTYSDRGLFKVLDLGEYWESQMHVPIPLGGIAVHTRIENSIAVQSASLIRQSLEYAFKNYPFITGYVKEHAQAMQEQVMRQHIDLYVNNYSLDLGDEGRQAIGVLYETWCKNNQQTPAELSSLFL